MGNEKRPPHADLCRYGWEEISRARPELGQGKQHFGRWRFPVPFQRRVLYAARADLDVGLTECCGSRQ